MAGQVRTPPRAIIFHWCVINQSIVACVCTRRNAHKQSSHHHSFFFLDSHFPLVSPMHHTRQRLYCLGILSFYPTHHPPLLINGLFTYLTVYLPTLHLLVFSSCVSSFTPALCFQPESTCCEGDIVSPPLKIFFPPHRQSRGIPTMISFIPWPLKVSGGSKLVYKIILCTSICPGQAIDDFHTLH
jgi:hypothetical protein